MADSTRMVDVTRSIEHAPGVYDAAKREAAEVMPLGAVLVVIGDLVGSRSVADRSRLQERFANVVDKLNSTLEDVRSPYTVTLGDEFQVVLSSSRRLFADLTSLAAELLGPPTLEQKDPLSTEIRFSIAVGSLATPINPNQAIGMDGPAFHSARLGIEQLKQTGDRYAICGLGQTVDELCNSMFALLSHELSGWSPRRHWVLAERMRRTEVATIAERVGVSPAAVYKNLTQGGVDVVCRNFLAVADAIQSRLEGTNAQ